MIEKEEMHSNIDPWLTGMTASTYSQYNDTISQIEQPSVMQESLLSITTTPVVTRKAKPNLGRLLTEKNIAMSNDDLSCSSISNIENVKPPTIMDDVESSTLSRPSNSSKAAQARSSDYQISLSISNQAIRNIVRPAGDSVQCFGDSSISMDFDLTNASVSQQLDQICPPTVMDEMTLTSHTLVVQRVDGATFTVEDGGNTIDDATDVFDEESTMTVGGGDEHFDIPELPFDSLQASPAHSSIKTTPVTVRKVSSRDIYYNEATLYQTYTPFGDTTPIRDDTETSGYKSLSVEMSEMALNREEGDVSNIKYEEENISSYLKQISPRQLFDEDITHIESEASGSSNHK